MSRLSILAQRVLSSYISRRILLIFPTLIGILLINSGMKRQALGKWNYEQ